jgi:hypothetical protein
LSLPLVKVLVEPGFGGASPYQSFANPMVRALLPDPAGGVWLATMLGSPVENGDSSSTTGSGSPSTYPSFWHAQFAP